MKYGFRTLSEHFLASHFLIVSLSFCFFNSAFPQTALLSGTIIDPETKLPLPYVNIGIIGKSAGTVSDEGGYFKLLIDQSNFLDSIRFSMLGYRRKTFLVKDLFEKYKGESFTLGLPKNTIRLKEVVIKSTELKRKVLGNSSYSRAISAGFESNALGSELGIVIRIKKAPTLIDDFNFFINSSKFDTLFFRVNIYRFENNQPGENILRENVFFTTQVKEGWNQVDLKKYHLTVDSDFMISIEWVKDFGDLKSGLYFSGVLAGKRCYFRKASEGNWEQVPIIGLSFNTTVRY